MKKRLVCVLLALVMVLGLLPTTALAAGETEITSVTISADITPQTGAKFKWPAAPAGANYTVMSMWMDNEGMYFSTQDSALMRQMTSQGIPYCAPEKAVYANGHTYALGLFLTPKAGYKFSEKLTVRVGGCTAQIGDADDFLDGDNGGTVLAMNVFALEKTGRLHAWEGAYAGNAEEHWGVCRDGDGFVFETGRDTHYYEFVDGYKTDGVCRTCGYKSTVAAPVFAKGGQPQDKRACCGGSTTLSAAATGKNVRYRWYCISPEEGGKVTTVGYDASLYIRNTKKSMDGTQYYCIAYNEGGCVQSGVATLTVDHRSTSQRKWFPQRQENGETVFGAEYHFPVCEACGTVCGGKQPHTMSDGVCTACGFAYGDARAPLRTVALTANTEAGKPLAIELAEDAAGVSGITVKEWKRLKKNADNSYGPALPISFGSKIETGNRYEAAITVKPTLVYQIDSSRLPAVTVNGREANYRWESGTLYVTIEDPGAMRNVYYTCNTSNDQMRYGAEKVVEGGTVKLETASVLEGFTEDVWGWCIGDRLYNFKDTLRVRGDTAALAVYADVAADAAVTVDTPYGKRTPADVTFETGTGVEVDSVVWRDGSLTLGRNDSFASDVNYTADVTLRAVEAADRWGARHRYVLGRQGNDGRLTTLSDVLVNGMEIPVTAANASAAAFQLVMVQDLRLTRAVLKAGQALPDRRSFAVETKNSSGEPLAYLSSLQWFSAPTDGPDDTANLLPAGTAVTSGRVYYARLTLTPDNNGLLATNAVTISGVTYQGILTGEGEAARIIVDNVAFTAGGKVAAPVLTVEMRNDQPCLSWTEIPGAAGYCVLRTGGEEELNYYTYLTSYTDRSAAPGETYTYTIRALGGGDTMSQDSQSVSFTVPVTRYAVTVTGGSGTGSYRPGTVVHITASSVANREFDKWLVQSGDVELSDAASAAATFVMPAGAVRIRATYHDAPPDDVKLGRAVSLGTGRGIEITWQKTPNAERYVVYRKAAGDSGWKCIANGISGENTSYVDTTAVMGTTYTYTVRDQNGTLLSKGYDRNGVTAKMTPATVKLLNAVGSRDSITVSWIVPNPKDTYTVYRRTADTTSWSIAASGVTGSSWTDTKVQQGVTYVYTVRAVNSGVLSADYDHTGVRAAAGVAVPANVTMKNAVVSGSSIVVTWEAAANAKTYTVYRKAAGDKGWSIIARSVSGTSYTDKSVTADVSYTYTVRGVASDGKTTSKGYDGVGKTAKVPKPAGTVPANVTMKNAVVSGSSIVVTWEAAANAKTYTVYRKAEGDKGWSIIARSVSGTSYTDKSVTADVSYTYTVRGVASDGKTTSKGYDGVGKTAKVPKSGTVPANVVMNSASVSSGSIVVTWQAAANAKTYIVYRKAEGDKGWSIIARSVSGTSYVDKNVTVGVSYTYTVRGVASDGKTTSKGYDGTGKTARATAEVTVPADVKLGAAAASGAGITVTWQYADGAAAYTVYRKAEGDKGWSIIARSVSGTSYTDKSITAGVAYTYTVRGVAADGKTTSKSYDHAGVTASVPA